MKASSNVSARRERRHFSGQQKVSIVKQHLVDGIAISDLCDKHQQSGLLMTHFNGLIVPVGDQTPTVPSVAHFANAAGHYD